MTESLIAADEPITDELAILPAIAPSIPEKPAPQDLWAGGVTPYVVGDPGLASGAVLERPGREFPEHHGTVLDGAVVRPTQDGPWTHVRGASVRGLAHRDSGTVRQDDYCFRQTDDDRYLVVAVADGVSAGALSHEAAMVAARFGCEVVGDWLAERGLDDVPWDHVLKTLSDLVVQRGRALLRRRGTPADTSTPADLARELATTLVLAVIDLRCEDGSYRIRVLRVGDSSAWVRNARAGWENLHEIKNDGTAIASSATAALPTVADFRSTPHRMESGEVLVLMSDGVGDPLGDGDNDLGRFLAEVWERPPSPLEFAAQVDFARKSFDDDRTAVAVWPG